MKKIIFFIIILLAIGTGTFLFFRAAHGKTTYYVDFAGGSDSNNGKSPSNPFKRCPGDPNSTMKAKSVKLLPGDMVILKGGVVYKGTIHILRSGKNDENRIVYDGNSAGTFGQEKPTIDGEHVRYQGFYSKEKGVKFVTIRNFEIKNMAVNKNALLSTGGIVFEADNESIAIENCYVHDIGIWSNDGKESIAGIGIRLHNPTNCAITGCELTKTALAGIHTLGGIDCLIAKNNIHHYINWGIDIAANMRAPTGNIIRGNVIHDLYHYDTPFWGGTQEPPHTDFIFIRRGDGERPYGNIVEQNLFYNNLSFSDNYGGTAMIFLSEADGNMIRNNIFINPHSYFTVSFGWGSQNNEFYNNTIYSPRSGGILIHNRGTGGGTKIKNNIIIAKEVLNWYDLIDEKNWQIDYNFYWTELKTPYHRQKNGGYYTFSDWQSLFKNDIHGTQFKSIEDFRFIDTSGYPEECHTINLSLRANSPLVDKGVALTGFSDDFLGATRHKRGTAWDVGAYELGSTKSP